MSTSMDVHRLIAEVKQRPALWDARLSEYKDRAASTVLWREISDNVGCDVELCKRKWKNLRDAYRAEVRRTERRVQRLKLEGHNDPQVSDSKWAFFKPMSFMGEIKRKRYATPTAVAHDFSSDSHEAFNAEASADDHLDMDDYCRVKMEHSTDDEVDLKSAYKHKPEKTANECTTVPEDDEEANELLFEQFKSIATPQAARRLSGSLSLAGSIAPNESPTSTAASPPVVATTALATITTSNETQTKNPNCKCTQREDQVHFLEDLEREEQKLMQSTRRDITRANANTLGHLGDSDYNFLVSFLPQMKRLNELQNLQFRAKMSELMLCIMAQPTATTTTLPSTTFSCISTTTPGLQVHHHLPSSSSSSSSYNVQQHHSQNHQQQQQHHLNEATTTTTIALQQPQHENQQHSQ